jgi:hypothetical protein
MPRTEHTPNGLATYLSADFRTYAPQVTVRQGQRLVTQLCEEWIGGRWEGFITVKPPKALRQAMGK